MDNDIIVALVGALFGFLGVIVGGWMQRKKNNAEAEKSTADANEVITSTVIKLIDPLNKKIEELEARVKTLESRSARYLKRIISLMDGIRVLINQLERAKLTPEWQPDEWNADKDD